MRIYQKFLVDDPGIMASVASSLLANPNVRNAAWNAGADAFDYVTNGISNWWSGKPVADSTGNT